MFKKIKLDRIYEIVNLVKTGFLQDGKIIDSCLKEVDYIPVIEAIAEKSMDNLRREGFTVERVNPKKANCIIRIFRHEGYIYKDDIFWTYGVDAFVKTPEGMKSSSNSIIDYSKYAITKWVFQDECFDIKPHFVDYFVKIS